MPTDISERGLEELIVNYLTAIERGDNRYDLGMKTGRDTQSGTIEYDIEHGVDTSRLFKFLTATQNDKLAALGILKSELDKKKFLDHLSGKLSTDGVIKILRDGFKYLTKRFDLYYPLPTIGDADSEAQYKSNIFSVTRQLHYSKNFPNNSIDFVLFINGLPIITCELKNRLTKQSAADAENQYKNNRNPEVDRSATILAFKRCIVHFAFDDQEVRMCTKLAGKHSWFLPFNKGCNDGAGNPVNPHGQKTDYLWKVIFSKYELSNIIENYTQVVEEKDEDTGKKTYKQIFPRYHQLDCVKKMLFTIIKDGVGKRYLIQHSAGSGKSNSIAWLAHQLVSLRGSNGKCLIDSIVVVTDRRNLDKQIKNTIKSFAQVDKVVGHAENSGDLKSMLENGKKIIITTVQKFPFILDDMSGLPKGSKFAIIIDEAHSSQSGKLSGKMNSALSGIDITDNDDDEDIINKIIDAKKMLKNASYFAFTATPKNKTLEIFGNPLPPDAEGKIAHEPAHVYTMKQAIQEGFILDVLKYYTPYSSYYKLVKTVEGEPLFDTKKAQKKLRCLVESDPNAISQKAAIIVEHFHNEVIAKGKVGGKARAMVVTSSIDRAIEYYNAISKCLQERNSQFKAIVAFSDKVIDGMKLKDSHFNGFPSEGIEKMVKTDPYRILVVADKFQTGYDEPLLHTMYVDKILTDIKAVQTLSRLNRADPRKKDVFILDFANDTDTIKEAFQKYYKTTVLSDESDPNKLNDLIETMESLDIYNQRDIDSVFGHWIRGADRGMFDPILDSVAQTYKDKDADDQIEFKASAKSFVRTYEFLSAIMPYGSEEWEKLSAFLTLLIPKLPSPRDEDNIEELVSSVALDSYRIEKRATMQILLEDENATIDPVPVQTDVHIHVPDMDILSNIITTFMQLVGNIEWKDEDKIRRHILEIPNMVSSNTNYQNAMKNSDERTSRIESDIAADKAVSDMMNVLSELYQVYNENEAFRNQLNGWVFNETYKKPSPENNNTAG